MPLPTLHYLDDVLLFKATYNNTIAVEIWTAETLNSALKQVEYFWESGFFKSKQVTLDLCDAIEKETLLLKQKAEKEVKKSSLTLLKRILLYIKVRLC
jgi:predicted lipase